MERHGTFSSSSMWRLMTLDRSGKNFGVPALKYIRQVNHERKLGRAINPERESRPTSWGKYIEQRAFDLLTTEYQMVSNQRLAHPKIPYWTGMPDVVKPRTVGDCKCPYSMDVFCDKIESLKDLSVYKKEFPEDYWQHVSNAILTGSDCAEAIIYCPYRSELSAIRESVRNFDGDQNKIAWINWASDEELPYLLDGGYYKNLNVVRFTVPDVDRDLLTSRVLIAGQQLINISEELLQSAN